jgi:hypothetical protein
MLTGGWDTLYMAKMKTNCSGASWSCHVISHSDIACDRGTQHCELEANYGFVAYGPNYETATCTGSCTGVTAGLIGVIVILVLFALAAIIVLN